MGDGAPFYAGLPGPFRSRWVWSVAERRLLPALFAVVSINLIVYYIQADLIGVDARIYRAAAVAWLAGGDPWAISVHGFLFAAPPPTLVPSAALTLAPEWLAVLGLAICSIGAALWAMRLLGLPWWWVLFPPIVEGVFVGNPNVIVLALLVVGRSRFDVVAGFAKGYAVVPAVLLGRWRSVAWMAIALLVTVPILPWATFFNQGQAVLGTLAGQSLGGYSAAAAIGAIPLAFACLLAIGLPRAAWLAVPVLWPSTQLHYSCLAVPGLTPLMAAIFAVPVHGSPVLGVLAGAVVATYVRRAEIVKLWVARPTSIRRLLQRRERGAMSGQSTEEESRKLTNVP